MDLSGLLDYVNIIILGICLCAGYMLKNAVSSKKLNKFIPLIVGTLGMVLAIVSNLDNISLEIIFMGLISGLASTGLYEAFKNLITNK